MNKNNLNLLDCTLRDGGYINNWKWGFESARDIIKSLVLAGVEVIETGFLRNTDGYDPDITVCNYIEELNRLIPDDVNNSMFSAMSMCSNYDVEKLSPYVGKGIEIIRVTAHDYDLKEGIKFAQKVQEKGYKLSINPINIMGYSDRQILWILDQVNKIHPYQFSIVDTFGSMKRRDLDRIVSLADNNLDKNIRLALHLHENMSLGCLLAQRFIDMHMNRPVSIDGSLMGIGRVPGNLPVELVADYLNDYCGKNYDIDYMMDAIQDYISPIKGEIKWGYTPAYFLSARFNLHRNYAEYYLEKGDLANRDINHILARFDQAKATVFDKDYAEEMYKQYMYNKIDDKEVRSILGKIFNGRKILIIAPGGTIKKYKKSIDEYIEKNNALLISVNFIPEFFKADYAFFSNNRRYEKINVNRNRCKIIVTSNISEPDMEYYQVDYNSLTGAFYEGCNSLVMLLKLLKELNVEDVTLAGADGYLDCRSDYYRTDIRSYSEHGRDFNMAVSKAISRLKINVSFLTPSLYERKE